uniref:RING-type domain-containing protein n=1 Tax=Leersia perrieri TaxID=77586 RepID=A0A0D9WHP5_9ORYZ
MALPCCAVEDDFADSYDDDDTDSDDYSDGWSSDDSDEEEDGLTEEEMGRLPWFAYCGDGGDGDGCCNICLEEMQDGERCRRLGSCGHAFHAACVDEWLRTRRTCPCCRKQVLVPPAAPTS